MRQDNARLYGAVAAAVLLAGAGGFGLSTMMNRPAQPATKAAGETEHAEEAGHADEKEGHGEEGHSEEKGGEEGVIALTPSQIQASGISVVSIGRGGGSETRLSGRVEPMVDGRAAVGASVSGRVERVLVASGQSVRAGQALAVLVSGDAATLRADADSAAAAADAARRSHQRDQTLERQGIVAREDVETSRAQALSAEAAARAARARVSAAGAPNSSGRLSISSPISGVVTSVSVGPGGFVAQGGLIAEVTNPARVELVFNAPPALAARVSVGSGMRIQAPSGEFGAVVTGVAAGAGGASGATVIRARPAGGNLPPSGSAVTATVVTGSSAGGLTVPSESVQTVEGASAVFVEIKGGFRATPVLIGRQAGGRTEIVRGLTGGERIAGANAFLLKAELAKGEAEHGH